MNHLGDTNKMGSKTPISDSTPHNVADLGMQIRRIERKLNAANDRIKRLEEAVAAYRTAYTPDGHVAPHDCFATGPKTGDPIQDLIACPGCWAERKAKEDKP